MEDIEDILNVLLEKNQKRPVRRHSLAKRIYQRLRYGWRGALLLLLLGFLLAWLLSFPLKKVSHTTTSMDVMLIKERESNKNNNVAYEIVGQITGWQTTTNKYDEIAIMISNPVMQRTLRNTHVTDSAYVEGRKTLGHPFSHRDSMQMEQHLADLYIDKIKVTYDPLKNQKTSIVTMSMKSNDAKATEKILNELVKSYNEYTRDYNNYCYLRTIKFLTHCIDSIRRELDYIDTYDENFSESNFIIDLSQQAGTYLDVDKKDENDVRNMELQRELLKIIRQYMIDMGDNYVVVPANTGIEDEQINRIVLQFNDLVMRRSNFLTSMGEDAMRVKTITNQIEDQRKAIIISIDKLTQAFDIRLTKYKTNKKESEDRLVKMPHRRIVTDKIRRERDIIMPLYTLLQQKRIEAIIARSAEQDLARIITPPYSVSENLIKSPKQIYMIGLLLGLIMAILYLWCLNVPEAKVGLSDVLKDCPLPIWGVIPAKDGDKAHTTALESLLTRIRMSGAKRIVVACGYEEKEIGMLTEELRKLLAERNITDIELIDAGCYHENPDLPELSAQADATLYCVSDGVSQMHSLEFIDYSVKEKLIRNGAVVVTNAETNNNLLINFGSFDYETPRGINVLHARKKG